MKRFREDQDGMSKRHGFDGNYQGPDHSSYVDSIKVAQRSSQNIKHAWQQYCESNGRVMFDPAKQSTDFIQTFLDQLGKAYLGGGGGRGGTNYDSGGSLHGSGGPGGRGYDQNSPSTNGNSMNRGVAGRSSAQDPAFQRVIELVKQGQRNSPEWKNMWTDWCQENGNGVNDPTRHVPFSVIGFVLKFGLAEVVNAPWASPYLVSLGELAKPFMVQTIKKGQSMSETWKEQWGVFADSKANGTRDPNRHDAGSLMEFFDNIALPQFGSEAWMTPYVTGQEAPAASTAAA